MFTVSHGQFATLSRSQGDCRTPIVNQEHIIQGSIALKYQLIPVADLGIKAKTTCKLYIYKWFYYFQCPEQDSNLHSRKATGP